MDTVILEGVEYLKASEAAKQFRYTSDYIGQLCRGKKVDARLVGRTWFVNPKSLVLHKQVKYSKKSVPVTKEVDNNKEKPAHIHVSVAPVVTNKTMKSLLRPVSTGVEIPRKLRVDYELDDESLIPTITKKQVQPPKMIRIQHADAKKVRVGGGKSSASFSPSILPDVALSGEVKVLSLPEESEVLESESDTNNSPKNIATSVENEVITLDMNKRKGPTLKPGKIISLKRKSVSSDSVTPIISKKTKNLTQKPILVRKDELKFTPVSGNNVQTVKISTAVLVAPLVATVLALVVVTALFSASSNVQVSKSSYQEKIVLQVANLLELLQQ